MAKSIFTDTTVEKDLASDNHRSNNSDVIELGLSSRKAKRLIESEASTEAIDKSKTDNNQHRRKTRNFSKGEKIGAIALVLLLFMGVMGAGVGDALLETVGLKDDPNNRSNAANSKSVFSGLNPFAPAAPSSTPQLAKEYIYAGSRLLAVEDADATAAPKADVAIWRPSDGYWWVLGSGGSQTVGEQWGAPTDKPVPGDYDGDGYTDFSVYRASDQAWYIKRSSDGNMETYNFGLDTDILVPADYDGDGKTDAAVWRPSTGVWYIRESSTQTLIYPPFGTNGDIPVPADYDGDGKADLAVWRQNDPQGPIFYVQRSSDLSLQTQVYGAIDDDPVVDDYDGDGYADFAVRRGHNWYILQSSDGQTIGYGWGYASDVEVRHDYDGDGKTDVAVWRESNGMWYIINSSGNPAQSFVPWGQSGDIPVPAHYNN